jgi:hypothetical protein
MNADSIPLLIGALADPCERVRIAAVHALACDRCKTGACRPAPVGQEEGILVRPGRNNLRAHCAAPRAGTASPRPMRPPRARFRPVPAGRAPPERGRWFVWIAIGC